MLPDRRECRFNIATKGERELCSRYGLDGEAVMKRAKHRKHFRADGVQISRARKIFEQITRWGSMRKLVSRKRDPFPSVVEVDHVQGG